MQSGIQRAFSKINQAKSGSSFTVAVPKFIRTVGGFVEFLVIIKYHEGKNQEWEIHRRFSDFQELSHLLNEHFKKTQPGFVPPQVPPKISASSLASDEALEGRRAALEAYLTELLNI
jgi:3-methyladenine DNA glycosylase Tag